MTEFTHQKVEPNNMEFYLSRFSLFVDDVYQGWLGYSVL